MWVSQNMEVPEWLHSHIQFDKHDKTCVSPSVCQRSPTQVIKHAGNTLLWGIVVLHPSSRSPLNHFYFIDIFSVCEKRIRPGDTQEYYMPVLSLVHSGF